MSLNFAKCELCFGENLTVTEGNSNLQQFQKVRPCIKVTAKYQLVLWGALLGDTVKRELLSAKIEELEISDTVEHIDAHYGFCLPRKCFSLPKVLYFWRTSTCFAEKGLLKHYGDILKKTLIEVKNVFFIDTLFTQSVFSCSQSGLGVFLRNYWLLPLFSFSIRHKAVQR